MEYSFLEFMKRIGIFIICAQSIIHFSAEKSYEKYVKILVGIMILAQFIVPVRALFFGADNSEIMDSILEFQKEMESAMENTDIVYEGTEMTEALQDEIKGKLESIAGKYGYAVSEVILYSEQLKRSGYEGNGEYEEPPRLTVEVYAKAANDDAVNISGIEKISDIEITVDVGTPPETEKNPGLDKNLEEMKKEFCISLGTDEAYVEVKVL